jgi:membrane protease YdiL (CAAX protease family)
MITVGREKIYHIFVIMSLASLSVIIPLAVFRNLAAVFLLYHIGMCIAVPLIDLLAVKRLSLAEVINFLGFNKANFKSSVQVGLLHGFVFLSLTIGSFFVMKDVFLASDTAASLEQWGVSREAKAAKLAVFIIMVLFNGIVEEVFWRGYTYGKIGNQLSKWAAIFVVTSFYTSYHLATVLAFFKISFVGLLMILFIFTAGLIWGWMRYHFQSTWASAIGHTLVTIGYMTVYLLL